MIVEWKVKQSKWHDGLPITLCGEFESIDALHRLYRVGGIEHEHGWYIVPGSINIIKR